MHFGDMCGEDIIKKLMNEADLDKDGNISKEDFMGMMQKYIDTHMLNMKKASPEKGPEITQPV